MDLLVLDCQEYSQVARMRVGFSGGVFVRATCILSRQIHSRNTVK